MIVHIHLSICLLLIQEEIHIFVNVEVRSEGLPFVPPTVADPFSHGCFSSISFGKNKSLQLYVRLLKELQTLKLGMVAPKQNQCDFLPLFLCHTLFNTRAFCSAMVHQLKINFLLRSVSL